MLLDCNGEVSIDFSQPTLHLRLAAVCILADPVIDLKMFPDGGRDVGYISLLLLPVLDLVCKTLLAAF